MLFRKVRTLAIGISRFVPPLAVLAGLGFWLVTPALAAAPPGGPLSAGALQTCLERSSLHITSSSGPSLPLPDDCSLLDMPASPEIPGLLLPDLLTLPPSDLEIVTLPDGSLELRLSNTIWNSGAGPLELSGDSNSAVQRTRVEQHLYAESGSQTSLPVGEFIWHFSHDHFHFEDFSIYELWTLSPIGQLDRQVSSSDKLSYCVIDTDIIDRAADGFSPYKRYGGCGQELQGLSVGWGDTYKSHLDGQSIPLSQITNGFYALKSTVNPDAILLESDFHNNAAITYFEIRDGKVELVDISDYIEQRCQDSGWWQVPGMICEV